MNQSGMARFTTNPPPPTASLKILIKRGEFDVSKIFFLNENQKSIHRKKSANPRFFDVSC